MMIGLQALGIEGGESLVDQIGTGGDSPGQHPPRAGVADRRAISGVARGNGVRPTARFAGAEPRD